MERTRLQRASWYEATTLAERVASAPAPLGRSPAVEADTARAQRRWDRWRSQPPFNTGDFFRRRLELDGLTEETLRRLLGEPPESVRERFVTPPPWLARLTQAFTHPLEAPSPMSHETSLPDETSGFLRAIEPLIEHGRRELHQSVLEIGHQYPVLPFDPETIEGILYANLARQLHKMMSRTIVLELNIARLRGVLTGTTAQERFQSFVQLLGEGDTALTMLEEYPVLARQLIEAIERWVAVSREFLSRLCADWEALQATFSPEGQLGLLVELETGAGDSHRGGRSVSIARFASDTRVVYKPKSLASDAHFQELILWLNARGAHPPLRTLAMLNRQTYGWVEYVDAHGCTAPDEVERFYQRLGGYLALFHTLEAADFHFENLIAAGEYPTPIDLEALFHPRVQDAGMANVDELIGRTIEDSVLRTGLLPTRFSDSTASESIDLSGLGAAPGQMTPYDLPRWEGSGTDEMRMTRKPVELLGGSNRPTLNGVDVDPLTYTEAIVAGFSSVYRTIQAGRDELLGESGLLARGADDDVRVILRPTRIYGLLLHESWHPDLLRSALDRDLLFDRLWMYVPYLPWLEKVIAAERDDLLKGDVPIFTARPGSRDLWTSAGDRLADYFDESGLDLVARRVRQMSEDNLERQIWFIRASLATLAKGSHGGGKGSLAHRADGTARTTDREQLLAAARAVGDRLETLALRTERDATWLGLEPNPSGYWSMAPLGNDLYDGLAGVALFLAYLGAVAGDERSTRLARTASETLRRRIDEQRSAIKAIGAFNGWGGTIYALSHLALLWDEPALLAEAQEIVGLLPPLIEQDEQLDIIAGAAGCLASLLSLHRLAPSERILATAIQCGEHLIAKARPMDHGLGWVVPGTGAQPLTGFSHGAAGIAWALTALAHATGEERFRTAANAGIAYERSLFSLKAGNWPDLRTAEMSEQAANNEPSFMTAWCHGAVGIGLSRLSLLRYSDDPTLHAEIETALRTTLRDGFGANHSLCHGDLGNLELLLQASQSLDDDRWRTQINRLSGAILDGIKDNGWICGIRVGVEVPGLMTGLAGIGYGLLRLAAPDRVPSVLLLEPPSRTETPTPLPILGEGGRVGDV